MASLPGSGSGAIGDRAIPPRVFPPAALLEVIRPVNQLAAEMPGEADEQAREGEADSGDTHQSSRDASSSAAFLR